MSRALDDLAPVFRLPVFEFLARTVEGGIPLLIVGTGRTQAEQDAAVLRGVSWVAHSKHQDGLAIDVCPYSVWMATGPDKLNWDVSNPQWLKIGLIAEGLGLRWGGRWTHHPDLGHFEYVDPAEQPPSRT